MPQCDECGDAVEKIHRLYKQRNYCHKCYVRVLKNRIVRRVVKVPDYIKLITWPFANNVKPIDLALDVSVLITL